MHYIEYRLDLGSQVGNSNSEEFPFYTSKNPEGRTSGVFAMHTCYLFTYFSVFAGFTTNRLISNAII